MNARQTFGDMLQNCVRGKLNLVMPSKEVAPPELFKDVLHEACEAIRGRLHVMPRLRFEDHLERRPQRARHRWKTR